MGMTAKEYLSQVGILNARIDRKQKQLDDIKCRITATGGTDYAEDRVKHSLPSDPVADRIIKYVDLENEINRQIDEYIDLRNKITAEINGLEDKRYISILGMRYLEDKTLGDISMELHYTYQYTCELHGQALHAFEEKCMRNQQPKQS